METHQPGKRHAYANGQETKGIILFSNHFVIKAENVLQEKSFRRRVNVRLLLRRFFPLVSSLGRSPQTACNGPRAGVRLGYEFTARTLSVSPTFRNRPGPSRSDMPSYCSGPVRKAGCRQFHTFRF